MLDGVVRAVLLLLVLAACDDRARTPQIIDAHGGGFFFDAPIEGTCVDFPDACGPDSYCDTTNFVCVYICPNGPGVAPFAAATITDATWTSEVQERTLLGAAAAAHGLDDLASDAQPYALRATLTQTTGPFTQHLAIEVVETGEAAHGAALPAAGTYAIGGDPHFRIVATSDAASDVYIGTAGTLALDTTPSTAAFAGSVANLVLTHVDANGVAAPDRCTQTADAITWNAAPTQTTP